MDLSTSIKSHISFLNKLSTYHQQQIDEIKKEISRKQILLYKNCEHEWLPDRALMSERTEYLCNKCGLYKDDYYYESRH